jgi:hypothetical protein
MRRRDFIAILGGHDGHASEGNASANARKLALCERTASEKWHPTYLRTLTDLMSEMGLVSRASPVQTAMRNCTRDEEGPFGFGSQVPISSHRKLLSPKVMVVNVAETSGQDSGRHGRERRAQANRCRSVESGLGDVKTGG